MKIKKVTTLLISIVLLAGTVSGCGKNVSVSGENVTAAGETSNDTHSSTGALTDSLDESSGYVISSEKIPFIFVGPNMDSHVEREVYFLNGNSQIPYYDMDTVKYVMEKLYNGGYGEYQPDPDYSLSYTQDGHTVTFKRENGSELYIDFDADKIIFDNYDTFVSHSYSTSFLSAVYSSNIDADGKNIFLYRDEDKEIFVKGEELVIDTGSYSIDMVCADDKLLIPAQTIADFLFAPNYTYYLYYGKKSYFGDYSVTVSGVSSGDGIIAEFYDGEKEKRTPELIDFTYNELCMVLDNEYGLKSEHRIESFDKFMQNLCYEGKSIKEYLCSEDAIEMDKGLYYLIYRGIDDIHSFFMYFSPFNDESFRDEVQKIPDRQSYAALIDNLSFYQQLRSDNLSEGESSCPGYQEIGNTAFVTVDSFNEPPVDGFEDIPSEIPENTVELIIYAHSRITREDSPIENVVLDLTCNVGGSEDSSAFVLSWLLGEASICFRNPVTGAYSNVVYYGDTNLDYVFDEKDNVTNYNRYCLISPVSFSCANLVPTVLKNSSGVTLIGQTTGGGACFVNTLSTASGSLLTISGPMIFSYYKNGIYYGTDEGIEPDIYFSDPENLYKREELVDYINGLK